jgi:hypothetical protein
MRPRALVILFSLSCTPRDVADQRRVRVLCGLFPDATVVEWHGFPSQIGFGQREGLAISGRFRPGPGWSAASAGYRPAPWPAARVAVDERFRLGLVIDGAIAVRCEAAGDDVLFAQSTRPCDTQPTMNDVILCVLEPAGEVRAVVRSAY